MSQLKQTYNYNGRQVDGQSVSFESPAEQWTSYTLEDGSTLKIKTVVIDVARLEAFNEMGDPVYIISAQPIIAVVPNPALKKKVQ